MISCIHGRHMCHIFWEKTLLCLIFSLLLSWGFMLCDICSAPLMVLYTSRLLHVAPTMRGQMFYYELLLLPQVGIMVCGWNQILRRYEYRLICGEGLLITWAGLDWLFPAIRFCPIIEDEIICLRCTVPIWSAFWMFESLSLNCFFCGYL